MKAAYTYPEEFQKNFREAFFLLSAVICEAVFLSTKNMTGKGADRARDTLNVTDRFIHRTTDQFGCFLNSTDRKLDNASLQLAQKFVK